MGTEIKTSTGRLGCFRKVRHDTRYSKQDDSNVLGNDGKGVPQSLLGLFLTVVGGRGEECLTGDEEGRKG